MLENGPGLALAIPDVTCIGDQVVVAELVREVHTWEPVADDVGVGIYRGKGAVDLFGNAIEQ